MAKKIHTKKQVKIKGYMPYEFDYACSYDWFRVPYGYGYGYPGYGWFI